MTAGAAARGGRLRAGCGWALRARAEALTVALVALATGLLVYAPAYWVADLGPLPDAAEYAVAARSLAHLGPYTLPLYGAHYPPRYPFGFSALIAPSYWLPHATLANGLYAVLALGVVAATLVYVLARRVAGRVAGVGAAATLLLSPQYLPWNHEIMSETATVALVAAMALLVYEVARRDPGRRRDALLILLGALVGLAPLVRLANVVALPALALALLVRQRPRADRARDALLLGVGPVLALVALAAYAQATFGGVTGTGYRFWVPYWYESLGRTFSLDYAVAAPGATGDSFAPSGSPNLAYYARGLVGQLPLPSLESFSPWFLLLALVGGVTRARDRRGPVRALAAFCAAFALLTAGLYAVYFFQSVRFMAPLVPLLALASGVGVDAGLRSLRAARLGVATATVALAALGLAATLPQVLDSSYLFRRYALRDDAPPAFQAQARTAALYQAAAPPGSVMVTDVFPLILGGEPIVASATVVPLSRGSYLRTAVLEDVPVFLRRQSEVNAALHAGVPVFTDNYTLTIGPGAQGRGRAHAALRAYGLTAVAQDGPLVLYRLLPTAASDATLALDPILSATPNPVPAGAGYGATTIAWDTGDGAMGQVYVAYDGGPERLFDEGDSGERAVAWIATGGRSTFTLYRGTRRQAALATITMARQDRG